jgi:Tfp pilus assembly protein PilN
MGKIREFIRMYSFIYLVAIAQALFIGLLVYGTLMIKEQRIQIYDLHKQLEKAQKEIVLISQTCSGNR